LRNPALQGYNPASSPSLVMTASFAPRAGVRWAAEQVRFFVDGKIAELADWVCIGDGGLALV